MKYLIFLLLPLISIAQLSPEELEDLRRMQDPNPMSPREHYVTYKSKSDVLLAKYPSDSLVIIGRMRLHNLFVQKWRCRKVLLPQKDQDYCQDALDYYNTITLKHPGLDLAKAIVYYQWAIKQGQKAAIAPGIAHLKKALQNGNLGETNTEHAKFFLESLTSEVP